MSETNFAAPETRFGPVIRGAGMPTTDELVLVRPAVGGSSGSTRTQRSSKRPSISTWVRTSLATSVDLLGRRAGSRARSSRRHRSGRGCPPSRARISCARRRRGCSSRSAVAEASCPGVQKPHWNASSAMNARCSGESSPLLRRGPRRSGARRRRPAPRAGCTRAAARPSTSTVQAPQVPSPQAILVPVQAGGPRSSSARLEVSLDARGGACR